MEIGDVKELTIEEFFALAEQGGTYEVETPSGWEEIGRLKKEQKDCFLLRTKSGKNLGAGRDHLVETKNGWERVDSLDIDNSHVNTKNGFDQIVAREFLGIKNTFDFEVLSDDHKYFSNDIVSHNCGKTLTCKWIRQLCQKNHLSYKIVTLETYRRARERGGLRELFILPDNKSGVIFFDDMDAAVKSRATGNTEVLNFLTALDGIETTEGVVSIFTTNFVEDLENAFVRPGRIDVFMPFRKPNKTLRNTFIQKTFDKDLLTQLDVEELLEKTEEYTFAELEEIRKLFCLDLIEKKEISVERTFNLFDLHRQEFEDRAKFGFNQLTDESDDVRHYDDFIADFQ